MPLMTPAITATPPPGAPRITWLAGRRTTVLAVALIAITVVNMLFAALAGDPVTAVAGVIVVLLTWRYVAVARLHDRELAAFRDWALDRVQQSVDLIRGMPTTLKVPEDADLILGAILRAVGGQVRISDRALEEVQRGGTVTVWRDMFANATVYSVEIREIEPGCCPDCTHDFKLHKSFLAGGGCRSLGCGCTEPMLVSP